MRLRRSTLLDSAQGQYFHVTSRVVDRRFIFGDVEKQVFLKIMRQLEGFTGVQVASYCLMSNHFHLIVYVPVRPESLPEKEVLKRMKSLYSSDQMAQFHEYLKELESASTQVLREAFFEKFRARMFHLSHFCRELKLRFSKYYNSRNDRKGTLWEERFKCSLIEGHSNALMNTAAYIELNPVRAGIVNDPKDYRWCSYTEAVAGSPNARIGIIILASGMNNPLTYKEAVKRYREFYLYRSFSQQGSRKGVENAEADLSNTDTAFIRMRYFLDGVVLGTREFVEGWYNKHSADLNRNRARISNKVKASGMEGLHTYRNVG